MRVEASSYFCFVLDGTTCPVLVISRIRRVPHNNSAAVHADPDDDLRKKKSQMQEYVQDFAAHYTRGDDHSC